MTHFQSPGWQLDATSQPSSPTSSFWRNPAFPISSRWDGRAHAAELLGWIVSFPWAFATRKIFFSLFPKDLDLSQPAQRRRFIICHNDAGLPVWKAVQGKRVRDFHAFSSSGLSLSRVIIHSCRRVRDDAPMTFQPPHQPTNQPTTSNCFVVADPKQKGLSEPNICCFLPEPPQPSVTISQQLRKYLNRVMGLLLPLYLQTFRWEQQSGQDGNVHRGKCNSGAAIF